MNEISDKQLSRCLRPLLGMEEAGTFRLLENDEGQPYWSGKCPGDKEGTDLDPGQPLELHPTAFNVGTVVTAMQPEGENCAICATPLTETGCPSCSEADRRNYESARF